MNKDFDAATKSIYLDLSPSVLQERDPQRHLLMDENKK